METQRARRRKKMRFGEAFLREPHIFLCVLRVSVLKNLFAVEPVMTSQKTTMTDRPLTARECAPRKASDRHLPGQIAVLRASLASILLHRNRIAGALARVQIHPPGSLAGPGFPVTDVLPRSWHPPAQRPTDNRKSTHTFLRFLIARFL